MALKFDTPPLNCLFSNILLGFLIFFREVLFAILYQKMGQI